MRGTTLRALPVCVVAFAAGCFLTEPFVGTPAAARTPTHAYWDRVNAAMVQKPAGGDLKSLVALVRDQTDQFRALDPEGVDPELVAAVAEVVRCEERVLEVADLAGTDQAVLRSSKGLAQSFADANRQAAEAKKRLRALRGPLNDRLGGGFAAIGG